MNKESPEKLIFSGHFYLINTSRTGNEFIYINIGITIRITV